MITGEINKKSMTKFYFILFLLFASSTGQGQTNKLVKEKVKYQYDNKKPNETYVPGIETGKEIQINFDCCFNDTVQIYVNDKLIDKLYLQTNESTNFTGHSITVKFDKKKKKTNLKVVLPDKHVYCNIVLDKKYRILNINRMEYSNKNWWITFRNFGIFYE